MPAPTLPLLLAAHAVLPANSVARAPVALLNSVRTSVLPNGEVAFGSALFASYLLLGVYMVYGNALRAATIDVLARGFGALARVDAFQRVCSAHLSSWLGRSAEAPHATRVQAACYQMSDDLQATGRPTANLRRRERSAMLVLAMA
tara:strand:- start:1865 stop:2302 length:438 start_codon:yes stop_codon:yes gene_type:complete